MDPFFLYISAKSVFHLRSSNHFRIAVLPGDGIGKEVMSACLEVLDTIQRRVGGFKLDLEYNHPGAEYFLK